MLSFSDEEKGSSTGLVYVDVVPVVFSNDGFFFGAGRPRLDRLEVSAGNGSCSLAPSSFLVTAGSGSLAPSFFVFEDFEKKDGKWNLILYDNSDC